MTIKNILLSLLAMMVFSCNSSSDVEGESTEEVTVENEPNEFELPKDMGLREWLLLSYEIDGKKQTLQGDVEISIKFTRDRCFGVGGCNTYSAAYTLTDKTAIQFGDIAATKKICNSIMGQEKIYFDLLKQSTSYEFKDAVLDLKGPNGKLVYRFKRPVKEG